MQEKAKVRAQTLTEKTSKEPPVTSGARLIKKISAMGAMKKGRLNLITDVDGVRVGHYTINEGKYQTGVTVILPTVDNIYLNKCVGGVEVINGFGKSAGLVQVDELGQIESPIALTNTLNVGKVCDALVTTTIEACQKDGYDVMTFNPIVAECNDSYLNTIQARLIGYDEVGSAIASANDFFEQGAVGGGRGMTCHGLKGGIGSASRIMAIDGKDYTLGVLVQANHGKLEDLLVAGEAVGKQLSPWVENLLSRHQAASNPPSVEIKMTNDKVSRDKNIKRESIEREGVKKEIFESAIERGEMGSIIVIMATDLPISALQVKRILKRATVGIARVGGYIHHGSGEIAIGFTTANRIPHQNKAPFLTYKIIADQWIDEAFRAMAEATEEAILKALTYAETVVGREGHCRMGLGAVLAEIPKEVMHG